VTQSTQPFGESDRASGRRLPAASARVY